MVEGMSIREAAREFGLHRDTVRKMLAYSVPPGYRRQSAPRRPNSQEAAPHCQAYLRAAQRRVRVWRRVHHGQGLRQGASPPDAEDVRAALPRAGPCPVRLRRGFGHHRRHGAQGSLLPAEFAAHRHSPRLLLGSLAGILCGGSQRAPKSSDLLPILPFSQVIRDVSVGSRVIEVTPTCPVVTAHLFPGLLRQLLCVLEDLLPEEWDLPTPGPGWSVHDLVAHLLGVEMGQLSMGRDDYRGWLIASNDWDDLVKGINDLNEQWVLAMRRLSPRLMVELLGSAGVKINDYFQSLDPQTVGPPVPWTGLHSAPMWMHIAREYTERWHHQQQLREAVGLPLLTGEDWFAPVLATFVHGLPMSYSDVSAPTGTIVRVEILGDSGGTWAVVRSDSKWVLQKNKFSEPAAQITMDEIDAWKLFTKSIGGDEMKSRVVVQGNPVLASKALETVSIIA